MAKARLIYGCGADSYYAVKMEMPDAFTWYQDSKGETHALMNALEIGRARKFAQVDHIHPTSDAVTALKSADKKPTMATMINWLITTVDGDAQASTKAEAEVDASIGARAKAPQPRKQAIEVPADFPAGLMVKLQELGLNIQPVKSSFFPQRAIKTAEEIEAIRTAQHINEKAFARAFEVLTAAEIRKNNELFYQGEPVTAEYIQGLMNSVNAQNNCISFNGGPIVACGAIGSDPHNRGNGVLKAHEFIIIDSFPIANNFYNADLTRTVLKGEPTDWHLEVYNAVKTAQQVGLDSVKAGVTGAEVHEKVGKSLDDSGFPTGLDKDGNNYGFFHGTGHAVGLEVHDDGAGLSPVNTEPLQENMVVTVEPGLYYPNKGGVRIEDIVAVTKEGIDNLTTLPKELVL